MKISILSLALVGSLVLVSCGSEEKKDDKKKEKTEKKDDAEAHNSDEKVEPKEASSENNDQYSKDWEEIKTAIKNKDLPGVGKFAAHDGIDAEELIERANDHHIWQVLESYAFEDLQKKDQDGQNYHVMYAYSQQDDGPKKELEIYLTKGETNLQIQMIVAKNF